MVAYACLLCQEISLPNKGNGAQMGYQQTANGVTIRFWTLRSPPFGEVTFNVVHKSQFLQDVTRPGKHTKKLLNKAIEIVDLPLKTGDFL